MSKRLRQEDGIALVMALGITVVLIIFVASMISYTSSNSRAATKSSADLMATQYADAGLNAAYSIIVNQNVISGGNPAAANLLGCNGVNGAADANGPSNCATPSPKVICVTMSGCASGDAGSASVYGFYSGTSQATYNSVVVVPQGTWLLMSSGYARNPQGTTIVKTTTALVTLSALNSGAVAAVWNHMFITAPLTTNVCAVDFGGNNMTITDPLYVIGNLCISGSNTTIQETVGQPIDLMVGGKLVLSGSGSKAGTDSTHPLTSGIVLGGCTTVSVSSSTTACDSGSYSYWVGTKDTFIPQDAPEMQSADITNDYNNSDPGPKHACASGGLPSTTFDTDTTVQNSNATFELLPNSTYTCVSVSPGTGVMSWNNSTKTLTINGNVYLDGNLTISQSGTYTGTGVIEVGGTITFNGNATALCATSPCNTAVNAWQGTSGNTSMLTLVALKSNTTSITFTDNTQTFQGSLWSQPSSKMTFVKNGVTVEGPISIGSFDATFNNATFKPLPVIKNMPPGAPLPPNSGATVGTMTITK